MKYRITFRNHFKALEFSFVVIIFLLAGIIYLNYDSNKFRPNIEINILIIFGVIFLPALYLHIEYYYYNRGAKLEIDSYQKQLNYTDKTGVTQAYSFDDLNNIIIYMAPSWHRGSSFQLLPFEQYHYARIYTRSGKEIIITCLMAQKVQEAIKNITGVPVEKKKRLFASVLVDNFIERNTLRK